MVSWNGTGFDLPVLHYRSLFHRVTSLYYWDSGDYDIKFKWNNYTNRFHTRHTDLMDILSGYQSRAYAPMEDIAVMLGFPGKMGFKGDQVFSKFQEGRIKEIRNYCETDVLNTYLIYLTFQTIRGKLSLSDYTNKCLELKNFLLNSNKEHLNVFLKTWNEST